MAAQPPVVNISPALRAELRRISSSGLAAVASQTQLNGVIANVNVSLVRNQPAMEALQLAVSKLAASTALVTQAPQISAEIAKLTLPASGIDLSGISAALSVVATRAREAREAGGELVVDDPEEMVSAAAVELDGVDTVEQLERMLTGDWGLTPEQTQRLTAFGGRLMGGTALGAGTLLEIFGVDSERATPAQILVWSAVITLTVLFWLKLITRPNLEEAEDA